MPRGRPHASWLRQVESHLKDTGMAGLASAWAMTRRSPKEYRRKVDAATRCSVYAPIWLDLSFKNILFVNDKTLLPNSKSPNSFTSARGRLRRREFSERYTVYISPERPFEDFLCSLARYTASSARVSCLFLVVCTALRHRAVPAMTTV